MENRVTQDHPSVRLKRRYPVPPDKVWRAWTDPQVLIQWFGPDRDGVVSLAELDVRTGGNYRIRFGVPGGEVHDVSGVYQEVALHRRLVFTWAWKSTPERVSLVTIDLQAQGGGTELRFVHDRFFNQAARDGHHEGWSGAFAKLDSLFI